MKRRILIALCLFSISSPALAGTLSYSLSATASASMTWHVGTPAILSLPTSAYDYPPPAKLSDSQTGTANVYADITYASTGGGDTPPSTVTVSITHTAHGANTASLLPNQSANPVLSKITGSTIGTWINLSNSWSTGSTGSSFSSNQDVTTLPTSYTLNTPLGSWTHIGNTYTITVSVLGTINFTSTSTVSQATLHPGGARNTATAKPSYEIVI